MKDKHKIKLHPLGIELVVNNGTPLIDVLHEYGIEFPCGGKGTCGKCKVKVLEGRIEIDDLHSKKINDLGLSDNWRLACISTCTGDITLEIEQFNHLILADDSEFSFDPVDGYGVAVDLGTTTLVAQLVDLQTAEVMAVETSLNPQVKYGADLISRIQHAIDGNANEMTLLIRKAIGRMIISMLEKNPVPVKRITIVGNTVMQLLFCDRDITPLSAYPFDTDDLDVKILNPKDLGWNFDVMDEITFYPSIGSFVGSDIVAGIYATGMQRNDRFTALVDLGTNGEIVVGNKDCIFCASTAAGPAFEGSNISMGMRAVTGAISSLALSGEKITAEVIGNTDAKGICGSALIDAVSLLRNKDMLNMFGLINSGEARIAIWDKVFLTQQDINEFLLAKSAIAAGLEILAGKISIQVDDIHEIYIAGGFGSYINIDNVIKTGMINSKPEKIHKMGNTALIGAKMFLFSGLEKANDILQKTVHINLEREANFQDIYINKMMLV